VSGSLQPSSIRPASLELGRAAWFFRLLPAGPCPLTWAAEVGLDPRARWIASTSWPGKNVQRCGISAKNNPPGRRPGDPAIGWMERGHRLATAMTHSETGDLDCALRTLTLKIQFIGLRQAARCLRDYGRSRTLSKLTRNEEGLACGPDDRRPAQVFAGKALQSHHGEGLLRRRQ